MHEDRVEPNVGPEREHSAQENNETEKQLANCQLHLKEWQNKYFYLSADFDNYKRRVQNERIALTQIGQSELVRKLLPVVDGIERACATQPTQTLSPEIEAWFAGLRMIHQSFQTFLKEVEVQEIATQADFDPEVHEALSQVDSSEHTSGQIVTVLQKGYKLKDTVLRPALVSVAR